MNKDHKETTWLASHYKVACPSCDSSDAFSVDTGGHGHCYSCDKHFPNHLEVDGSEKIIKSNKSDLSYGTVKAIHERGLELETCKLYNYQVSKDGTKHLAFLPNGGQKIRKLKGKTFFYINKSDNNVLFGQDKFVGNGVLVITEGEIDAMSAYQMFGVSAVSITHGTPSAMPCITSQLDYIREYAKVILAFDNDDAGKAVSKQAMELFKKEGIVAVEFTYPSNTKDLNECLMNGYEMDVVSTFKKISKMEDKKETKPTSKQEYYYVADSDKFYSVVTGRAPRSLPSRHMLEHLMRMDNMDKGEAADYLAKARSFYGKRHCVKTIEMPYTKPGVSSSSDGQVLNISALRVTQPVKGKPERLLKFFSELLGEGQKTWLISWLSHFYKGCKSYNLTKGQAVWLGGDQGSGKTLFITKIMEALVGKGGDATPAVVGSFSGDAFKYGFCHIDDKLAGLSPKQRTDAFAFIKSLVASSTITSNRKFGSMQEVKWNGRVIIATNLGVESATALPSAEAGDKDKYSLLKCTKGDMVSTLGWNDWHTIIEEEKHFLADYLLRWEIPEELQDNRFGTIAHHNSELIELVKEQALERPYAECIQDYLLESKQDIIHVKGAELLSLLKEFEQLTRPKAPRVNDNLGIRTFGKHLRTLASDNSWIAWKKVSNSPIYTIKQINLNPEE